MIELFEKDICSENRQSSKGNQLKWNTGGRWYKADQSGYQGLAEYTVSCLLKYSDLKPEMITMYETEQIKYRSRILNGCSSADFLKPGESLITLERLFHQFHSTESFYSSVFRIPEVPDRASFLIRQTEALTGIHHFGDYLCLLLEIDAFFLNEDRHLHNIAVIQKPDGNCRLCPVFDNGASLMSDTEMDYPLSEDTNKLMKTVKSKTIAWDFQEQLDAVESMYPQQLYFHFTHQTVDQILAEEPYYPAEIKERVREIIYQQMRKYSYMF
ncbi:MAG: hypothetical protein Q4D24_02945 [Erysipelotrichaceae bacterium]|nr:hypothetical protein [Erysipelotrichaceae bacterium]